MGRLYRCDYCCRSFRDSAQNRAKHLTSSQHLRAKHLFYDNLIRENSASTVGWLSIAERELQKSACGHYYRHGWCRFGEQCRYSHLNWQTVCQLKGNIAAELGLNREAITSAHTRESVPEEHKLIDSEQFKRLFSAVDPQRIPVSLIPAKLDDCVGDRLDW